MPQGEGTYGSQVGRPSKKNKYQVDEYQDGGSVDPFSLKNPEGVLVQEALDTIGGQVEQSEFPTSNAMDRSEIFQLGGMIQPPTVPSITPQAYKKGGKVKK